METKERICKSCFISEGVPGVTLDADGVCNNCQYYQSETGKNALKKMLTINRIEELRSIAGRIKKESTEKKLRYDCIIGASGGFDSTYVIYVAKKLLNLNPLVVKYDNGLCHEMANKNLIEACKILDIDLKITPVTRYERAYMYYATKALVNLGVFFTACFSCHYIIASIAYLEAKKEGLRYMLTSSNYIEKTLADNSHGFMLKSLIRGFFRCGLRRMLNFIYYELIAQYYFVKLKFQYDGFLMRFLKNLVSLHPVTPAYIKKINISDYMAWDWNKIEKILREELAWDTPRHTKVPYFRFDCHYSAMIDKSFKRTVGFSEHALLCNWFAHAGIVSKETILEDFNYMNDDRRIDKEIKLVLEKLDLKDMEI